MPSRKPTTASVDIFVSYAHRDEVLCQELKSHLSALSRQGIAMTWHDREIVPGQDWEGAIDDRLESAQIILLLISPDFLFSDYCYDIEMQYALERHAAKDACVIPVILRSVEWSDAPFCHLQALPKNGTPVNSSELADRDEAFVDVVRGIKRAIETLSTTSTDDSGLDKVESETTERGRDKEKNDYIELTLERDYETFTDQDKDQLGEAIKKLLEIDDIKIIRKRRGSVKVTVEVPTSHAERLLVAVQTGELRKFSVVKARYAGGEGPAGSGRDRKSVAVKTLEPPDPFEILHGLHLRAFELSNYLARAPQIQHARREQAKYLSTQSENFAELLTNRNAEHLRMMTEFHELEGRVTRLEEDVVSRPDDDELMTELNGVRARHAELEQLMMSGYDEVDAIQTEIESVHGELERAEATLANIEIDLQERRTEFELKDVRQQIELQRSLLTPKVRKFYDALVEEMGDDAMAEIDGEKCGACDTEITQRILHQLYRNKFACCPSCGRLLYRGRF